MSMRRFLLSLTVFCLLIVGIPASPAHAAGGEFSLQVYPSPLVVTVKPGQLTNEELKVRNTGVAAEDLVISPRAFKIDSKTQQLELSDDQKPDVANWITFSAPRFSVQPGQTATENIKFNIPSDAGYSYSFALVITRANNQVSPTGRSLEAKVAVFALINVDKPGAVRSLEVTRFAATKSSYDYLPATFEIDFKNTGNTIVQPAGNVFIQHGSTDATPLATLDVNQAGGYILPGTTRTITLTWDDGFQVLVKKPQADGSQKEELVWNWNKLSSIRMGQYTAKLVAIYDDGHRDVPLQAETTFWVFPWQMLLAGLAIVALLAVGMWSIVSKAVRASRKIGGQNRKIKL